MKWKVESEKWKVNGQSVPPVAETGVGSELSAFDACCFVFCTRRVAGAFHFPLPTPHFPPLSPHRGLSLLEVIAAIGVIAVGLLGLAALLPVGGVTIFEATKADRAGNCGRAAIRDIVVRRMLDPNNWVNVNGNPTNPSFVITSAIESGNTVTITTATANGFPVGGRVSISGVGAPGYNGMLTVASIVNATTFTYTAPITGLAPSGGGTATLIPSAPFLIDPLGVSSGTRPLWAASSSASCRDCRCRSPTPLPRPIRFSAPPTI